MREVGPVSRRRFDSEELVMMRRVTIINTRTIAPRQLARRTFYRPFYPRYLRLREKGRERREGWKERQPCPNVLFAC